MHPAGLLYAYVRRQPAAEGPINYDETLNVRGFETVYPQDAPDPIRSSDFVNEGKPWGKGRLRGFFTFGVNRINSVSETRFGVIDVLDAPANHPTIPRTDKLPVWEERKNLTPPPAVAYGSLVSTNPDTSDPYARFSDYPRLTAY